MADSLLALAGESVTLPDTGSIETDLETHLDRVLVALTDEPPFFLYDRPRLRLRILESPRLPTGTLGP